MITPKHLSHSGCNNRCVAEVFEETPTDVLNIQFHSTLELCAHIVMMNFVSTIMWQVWRTVFRQNTFCLIRIVIIAEDQRLQGIIHIVWGNSSYKLAFKGAAVLLQEPNCATRDRQLPKAIFISLNLDSGHQCFHWFWLPAAKWAEWRTCVYLIRWHGGTVEGRTSETLSSILSQYLTLETSIVHHIADLLLLPPTWSRGER